jgi:5'-phosphate synthase pdxT subunit
MTVGILALQGAFIEHKNILDKMNIQNILIKKKEQVQLCDKIIIPGGESTTMNILNNGIFEEINKHIINGKAVWGTCAGLILLSNNVVNTTNKWYGIGGLNITTERNYFGSQLNSSVVQLPYHSSFQKSNSQYFKGILIRAPVIKEVGQDVVILNQLSNGDIIAIKQGNILGTCFHPELIEDNYDWYEYFLNM